MIKIAESAFLRFRVLDKHARQAEPFCSSSKFFLPCACHGEVQHQFIYFQEYSSSSNSSSSNSSSSCSEVKKPTARATIVVPSSLSRCHNSQNPPYSRIGTSFDTCCKLSHCELCHERQRSRRAGLMLDVIKTLPKSGRSNKKKFHQILDNILSHT